MHLRAYRDDLIESLQKSANIIPAKTGAAFLRTIWIKAEAGVVRIMATDSNLEFCGECSAEILQEGLVGVQGRSFYDLMRKLPAGQITLKLDESGQSLLLEQGSRKYKLPTNDPNWFQNISDFPAEGSIFWSGDFLSELIDKVAFCISDEDAMEAIACMNMRPVQEDSFIEVCGLNGHQFAMFKFLNDDLHALLPPEGVLIQKKFLMELKKWLTADEIEMAMSGKRLFFRTGDKRETFSLPLSYYQYPDYHAFLGRLTADDAAKMEASRAELTEALDRISIFNTDNNRCTYFTLAPDEVTLHSQGQDVGMATESLAVAYQGDIPKIAFPTKNLIEILGHFASGQVSFTMTGGEGPCGVTGEEDAQYLVIIMPMKIVEETYYNEEEA